MMDEILDALTLVVLILAVIPLGGFIITYTTRKVPGSRWRRRFYPRWAKSFVGRALMAMVGALFSVLAFVFAVRFTGDFPGRGILAFVLYATLMGSFWGLFTALWVTQRHDDSD